MIQWRVAKVPDNCGMATVQRGVEDKSLVSGRKMKSKVAETRQSGQSKGEIKSYAI